MSRTSRRSNRLSAFTSLQLPSPRILLISIAAAYLVLASLSSERVHAFTTTLSSPSPRRSAVVVVRHHPSWMPSIISTCKLQKHQQCLLLHDGVAIRTTQLLLLAKTSDNDDDDDNSNNNIQATIKGSQKKKKKKSETTTASVSSSSSRGKKKGTSSSSKKKQSTTKRPIEISAKSLSTSQLESTGTSNAEDEVKDEEDDGENYDYAYHIPKTGYSLADTLENNSPENKERFETTLTPIVTGINVNSNDDDAKIEFEYDDADGFPIGYKNVVGTKVEEDEEEENSTSNNNSHHQGVARIDTISTLGNAGEEPVRWVVSLDDTTTSATEKSSSDDKVESFALIDLPPYSDRLVNDIRTFMDPTYNATTNTSNDSSKAAASLDVILLTNQQSIHYDASPAVYVTRKSDLKKWKKAFPTAQVIMYRLDIPRECREEVTQVLDGYGPWGWNEENDEETGENKTFVETGRPLTIEEWDDDTKAKVLTQGEMPPDDLLVDDDENSGSSSSSEDDDDVDAQYSPEAIRLREEKYRLLAVYTPGSTFGSVTYIFPRRGICCSGNALPIESSGNTDIDDYYDDDDDDARTSSSNSPIPPQGPRIDYQGYLATSASRPRQMSSASSLINTYGDRFRVVLPARGDIVFLDTDVLMRKRELLESVGLYQKVSDIYNRLGITE